MNILTDSSPPSTGGDGGIENADEYQPGEEAVGQRNCRGESRSTAFHEEIGGTVFSRSCGVCRRGRKSGSMTTPSRMRRRGERDSADGSATVELSGPLPVWT